MHGPQLAVLLGCPFLAAAGAFAQQNQVFSGAQYPVGGSPYWVVLGDLDRDGRLDAVTADSYPAPGFVTVALGDGRGGFGAPMRATVGTGPKHVVLADLDGDQRLDAVATHDDGTGVSVLLGDGAGGWRSVTAFATGGRSVSVAVTDIDVDGDADIVTGTQFALSDSGLSVLLGDGTGAFAAPSTFVLTNSFPPQVAVGRLDGDSRPDVFAVSFTHMSVYLGDAASVLRAPVHLPAATFGGTPAIADLDEDGRQDLVVAGASNGNGHVMLYLGDGNGGFSPPRTIPNGAGAIHALVQDIDADGHVDVVTGDMSWSIRFLRGDGGGNLTLAQSFPGTWTLESLAAGDLTGDGSLDVVAASRNNNAITPILSTAPGRFDMAHSPIPASDFTNGMALFDVDRDGAIDVVTTDQTGLKIRRGDRSGTFAAPIPIASDSAAMLTPCNLDGDGHADLVAIARNAIRTWRGDGSGSFVTVGTFPVSEGPRGLAVGDLDGDGNLDTVTVNAVDQYPRLISRMDILRGDGGGGFAMTSSQDVTHVVVAVALADVDRAHGLDIVTAHRGATSSIRVYLNDGAGHFGTPMTIPIAEQPLAIALADLDLDGDIDVAAVTQTLFGASYFAVLDGDGRGGFAAPRSWPAGVRPFGMALGDFDGDGRLDALVAGAYLQVAILFATGGGQFSAPVNFTTGGGVVVADVDADGRVDLASLLGGVLVSFNRLPDPAGVAPYGTGTPGCDGIHGTSVTGTPRVNSPDFGIVTTNLPAGAFGAHYLAVGADVPGTSLFGIRFHVDLLAPWVRWTSPGSPTATNTAVAPLPIPNLVHLVGATVFAQSLWVLPPGAPCRPSALGISSGRGVRLTIQP